MRPFLCLQLASFLVVSSTSIVADPGTGPEPSKVILSRKAEGSWQLNVDGQPYWIKGAGAFGLLPELAAAGANSVRSWQSRDDSWFSTTDFLDEAHGLGLTVMLGLELPIGQDFDYSDEAAVARVIEQQREVVRSRRDHPALLLWGIGNEIEWRLTPAKARPVWKALNRIARMVKEEDPNHPTVIVLAGDDLWKIQAVKEHCPDIDILGLNVYQTLPRLPAKLKRAEWEGPYLVTEFGYRGWWAQRKTDWGAITELSSAKKADEYRKGFDNGIRDQPACIGSYAFIWGNKEEATFTYFGTHLGSGEPTASVDTLTELWTGMPPENRAPRIESLQSPAAEATVPAGSRQPVEAILPGNAPVDIEWTLATDRSHATVSGDVSKNEPATILSQWKTKTGKTELVVPKAADSYRLYLTVRDANEKAATANFPFKAVVREP